MRVITEWHNQSYGSRKVQSPTLPVTERSRSAKQVAQAYGIVEVFTDFSFLTLAWLIGLWLLSTGLRLGC